LDPRRKFAFFDKCSRYVPRAHVESRVTDIFNGYAAKLGCDSDVARTSVGAVQGNIDYLMADAEDNQPNQLQTELEQYLEEHFTITPECKKIEYCPLQYWKEVRGQKKWPVVQRLVRDFYASPGSSVDVERMFSASGQMCTKLRTRLKGPTIEMAQCLRAWFPHVRFNENESSAYVFNM